MENPKKQNKFQSLFIIIIMIMIITILIFTPIIIIGLILMGMEKDLITGNSIDYFNYSNLIVIIIWTIIFIWVDAIILSMLLPIRGKMFENFYKKSMPLIPILLIIFVSYLFIKRAGIL
jgi:hypothetical protein